MVNILSLILKQKKFAIGSYVDRLVTVCVMSLCVRVCLRAFIVWVCVRVF